MMIIDRKRKRNESVNKDVSRHVERVEDHGVGTRTEYKFLRWSEHI